MNLTVFKDNYTYVKNTAPSEMKEVHYHHHYEIYYLLSGQQNYFINGFNYEIQKGNVVTIRPGQMHKTSYGFKGTRVIINFNDLFLKKYMSPSAIKLLLSFFDKIIIAPDADSAKNILNLFDKLSIVIKNKQDDEVFLLLIELFTILNKAPSANKEQKKKNTPILSSCIKYIQENYSTITGLDEAAKVLYVSKYYICKLFSKHLQTTFNDYLLQVKLKNAESQLRSTDHTISEIATSCGFGSATYFCQVFNKNFGISPLKYRELLHNTPPQNF